VICFVILVLGSGLGQNILALFGVVTSSL